MDGAWKRFEEQLQKEEEIKKRQADQFQEAITRDQKAIESEIIKRLSLQEEHRRGLDQQITTKYNHQDLDNDQKKYKDRTSFGPEENQLLFEILERRNSEMKQSTKQELQRLMRENMLKQEFMSQLEKSLDQNMIE